MNHTLIRRLIAVSILVSYAVPLFARPTAPTRFTSFDGKAPGGRALAMGLAYTSIADDSSSVYFNPAGMANIAGNTLAFSYEIGRQSDLGYDELFSAETLRNSNLMFLSLANENGGFSWRPLADYTDRSESGLNWEENEVKVSAYTFSVSHKNNKRLISGMNLSYLSGRIGQARIENSVPSVNISDGNGVTADLGFLYLASPQLQLGLTLQNLLGFMWWADFEPEQLPLTARAGFAYRIEELFTFTSDWEQHYYRKDGGTVSVTHFGIEQRLGLIALRGGMYGEDLNDQEKTHYTAGLGYDKDKYRLSIAGEKYKVDQKDVFRYLFSLDLPL